MMNKCLRPVFLRKVYAKTAAAALAASRAVCRTWLFTRRKAAYHGVICGLSQACLPCIKVVKVVRVVRVVRVVKVVREVRVVRVVRVVKVVKSS